MKLLFTPQATRDLGEIADYVHENSPASALRIRASDQSAAAVVVLSVQHPAREREHEDKE